MHVNVSENGDLSSSLHNENERPDSMVLHNVFSTHTVQCRKHYCSASLDSSLDKLSSIDEQLDSKIFFDSTIMLNSRYFCCVWNQAKIEVSLCITRPLYSNDRNFGHSITSEME